MTRFFLITGLSILSILKANAQFNLTKRLDSLFHSDVNFVDYDNDNKIDVLLTGSNRFYNEYTFLYKGNNLGNFNSVSISPTSIKNMDASVCNWGDYDNDGDMDLFLAGNTGGTSSFSAIYRNDGGNVFIDILDVIPNID